MPRFLSNCSSFDLLFKCLIMGRRKGLERENNKSRAAGRHRTDSSCLFLDLTKYSTESPGLDGRPRQQQHHKDGLVSNTRAINYR
jgi:hypothetical protein